MKPSAPRIKERKASSFLENSERIAWGGHFTTKKRTILTDMNKDLQMISSFSLIFSEFLRFSLFFSDILSTYSRIFDLGVQKSDRYLNKNQVSVAV